MENAGESQQPAYGHPATAFAHVLFKAAALGFYIICGFLKLGFITNFVVIIVCLMLDFWITKNVSGRLLVGLRWWNEVTDDGGNWRFESLAEGQRAINKKDSACFWWTLYVMPVAWLVMGILALVRLKFEYLLVVIVAVVLTGSNVIGFTKCSKQASKQIRDMASSAITTGLTAAMSRV